MSDMSPATAPKIGADMIITVRPAPGGIHKATLTIGDWTTPCVVGRNGIVPPALKREGDACTPAGRFALRYGFYEPGVFDDAEMAALPYPFKPTPADYSWIENPTSPDYNRMRAREPGEAPGERAANLFDMFIPIGWNDATPVTAGGSAIFLHAARPEMTGTAGCVAVPHDQLMELARRLRPGMVIDICPTAEPPVAEIMETVTFHAQAPGPRVIITGAVHGNEGCGPAAITRIISEFRNGQRKLRCGSVTFVPVVNALAYRLDQREGERNLNRDLHEYPVPTSNEDRIANLLCPLLRAHDVLIDLHSFASQGPAFALLGPAAPTDLEPRVHPAAEMDLVNALGLPIAVYGWMPAHLRALETQNRRDEIAHAIGTTEFMRFGGGTAITVECGQHKDPAAVDIAYQVITRGLAHLGLIASQGDTPALPQLWEIGDAIFAQSDEDTLIHPFATGTPVVEGEVIGTRADGTPIKAPHDGALIFASGVSRAGTEMCFLCRPGVRG